MSLSFNSKPTSLFFLIAKFVGRRSQGYDSDKDTEVDDSDQDTEVDDLAGVEDYEDDEDYDYRSHPPRHPQKWIGFSRLGCAITSLIILPLVVIGLSTLSYVLWSHAQTQNYLEINGLTLVGQVSVNSTSRYPHHMNVNLFLDDNNGHEYLDSTCSMMCTLSGDNVILQGIVITYPAWQGVLGLHPKFKLTILRGIYANPAIARKNTPGARLINGGNDGYFGLVQAGGWLGFLGVSAAYSNSVKVPANGHTYNVYVSENGLSIKLAN